MTMRRRVVLMVLFGISALVNWHLHPWLSWAALALFVLSGVNIANVLYRAETCEMTMAGVEFVLVAVVVLAAIWRYPRMDC
jgi:hypothetical protein